MQRDFRSNYANCVGFNLFLQEIGDLVKNGFRLSRIHWPAVCLSSRKYVFFLLNLVALVFFDAKVLPRHP
uniref:Transposase n=1 Tax=Panagrellus redivivus TaxID=6233 RepID=A0A7E4ZY39_PANRE